MSWAQAERLGEREWPPRGAWPLLQVLLQQPNLADPVSWSQFVPHAVCFGLSRQIKANPFGHVSQNAIGLCIGTGVSGAFFCALSEPVGRLAESCRRRLFLEIIFECSRFAGATAVGRLLYLHLVGGVG